MFTYNHELHDIKTWNQEPLRENPTRTIGARIFWKTPYTGIIENISPTFDWQNEDA